MKRQRKVLVLLVFLGAFLASLPVQAKCASHYVSFSPAKNSRLVPRNVQPIVQIYGWKRYKLAKLLEGAVLVHRHQRIPLKVHILPTSRRSLRNLYALLQPSGTLTANTTYVLILPTKKHKSIPAYMLKSLKGYKFTTSSVLQKKPTKAVQIVKARHSFARLGCGPASRIQLQLKNKPSKHTRFLLKVTRVIGKKTERFEVFSQGPSFGHGMCSGNFGDMRAGQYTVRILPMNLAGVLGKVSNAVTVKVGEGTRRKAM